MNIMHASISEVPLVSLVLEKLFIPFVRPEKGDFSVLDELLKMGN